MDFQRLANRVGVAAIGLTIFAGIILFIVFKDELMETPYPRDQTVKRSELRAAEDSVLLDDALRVLRVAKREGVIDSWSGGHGLVKAVVGPSFYTLTFAEKQKLAEVLAITAALSEPDRVVPEVVRVDFHDRYSNHVVAEFGPLGLKVK